MPIVDKSTLNFNTFFFVLNRSVANTSTESKLTNLKGNFENINDEVNNTRLAQRFESLYSQKWVLLIKWMVKHCQTISEVDRISLLTNIMKVYIDIVKLNYSHNSVIY